MNPEVQPDPIVNEHPQARARASMYVARIIHAGYVFFVDSFNQFW